MVCKRICNIYSRLFDKFFGSSATHNFVLSKLNFAGLYLSFTISVREREVSMETVDMIGLTGTLQRIEKD